MNKFTLGTKKFLGQTKAQFSSDLERIEQTIPDNGGAPAARDMDKTL